MMGDLKPSRIEFTRRYSDDSGVEVGVVYDARDQISPMRVIGINTAGFAIEHLDFVIDALTEIRRQITDASQLGEQP